MAHPCLYIVTLVVLLIALIPPLLTLRAKDPFTYMFPNALLFFPSLNARLKVSETWHQLVDFDKMSVKEHDHVPVIDAKDYTWEKLKVLTKNWRSPAIVRGLFKDTPAVKNWKSRDYLSTQLGKHKVPVIQRAFYGKPQNNKTEELFEVGYSEIYDNPSSNNYLFFPMLSRDPKQTLQVQEEQLSLRKAVNELVTRDLQLDKLIWNGFSTERHKTFYGSQFVIGRGLDVLKDGNTTGTGWHCAPGNNWFVQAVGKKKWFFMDPIHSALMKPLRGGTVHMMTGQKDMEQFHDKLPLQYGLLEAGDLLYNPDWQWHTIKNYDAGMSIGLPIREMNVSLLFRNNFHYSSIVTWNKVMIALGLDLPLYNSLKD